MIHMNSRGVVSLPPGERGVLVSEYEDRVILFYVHGLQVFANCLIATHLRHTQMALRNGSVKTNIVQKY